MAAVACVASSSSGHLPACEQHGLHAQVGLRARSLRPHSAFPWPLCPSQGSVSLERGGWCSYPDRCLLKGRAFLQVVQDSPVLGCIDERLNTHSSSFPLVPLRRKQEILFGRDLWTTAVALSSGRAPGYHFIVHTPGQESKRAPFGLVWAIPALTLDRSGHPDSPVGLFPAWLNLAEISLVGVPPPVL